MMNTKYDEIYASFKDKITDPDLLLISEEFQTEYLKSLMDKAIARCSHALGGEKALMRDDSEEEFLSGLSPGVIDIITEWMSVFWLEPYVNNSENLRNALSTKDFEVFSPANLLEKVCARYNSAKKDARSLANDYSYSVNNIALLKKSGR